MLWVEVHFGLALSKTRTSTRGWPRRCGSGVKVVVRARVMLFTFRTCRRTDARFRHYSVDGGQISIVPRAGKYLIYGCGPTRQGLLPHVLKKGPRLFSGHFVFSGPPPGVGRPNCRGERGGGSSFWE